MLMILSGCSGVGKNTVINQLISREQNYEFFPTFTTRSMREGERSGFPYHFISTSEFEDKIKNNELLEYEKVHTNYYGTPKNIFVDNPDPNKVLIKDIDVLGTINLFKLVKDTTKVATVFLTVSSKDELVSRLIGRGEKDIDLRLSRFELEMSMASQYSYIINNHNMENTIDIINLIKKYELNSTKIAFDPSAVDQAKVDLYTKQLQNGEVIDPVKIKFENSEFSLVDGVNRLAASYSCGIDIAKYIE